MAFQRPQILISRNPRRRRAHGRVRGYGDGCRPTRLRHKPDFLNYVSSDVFRGLGGDPERAVRAVLNVMSARFDPARSKIWRNGLARHLGVEVPIVRAVDRIVNEGASIDETFVEVLAQPAGPELGDLI